MKTQVLRNSLKLALALGAGLVSAKAATQAFDFKDPKGVNNVQFKLDAPLEAITGTGTGISGIVEFDPAAPEKTSGTIVLEAASLTVGNPLQGEHLRGEHWLDVTKFPKITFAASKIDHVKVNGNQISAEVTGVLTVKGVSRSITAPVTFTYLADKLGARLGNDQVKGDLLVLRASFEINRSDFGIMPGQMTDKVAETIHLSLSIAGASPKS